VCFIADSGSFEIRPDERAWQGEGGLEAMSGKQGCAAFAERSGLSGAIIMT